MVDSAEGTRAIALELCREFEDKFLQHITTGEVSFIMFVLWYMKIVLSVGLFLIFNSVYNHNIQKSIILGEMKVKI